MYYLFNLMKRLSIGCYLALLLMHYSSTAVYAQEKTVTGIVKDFKTGNPLPGVTVSSKSRNVKSVTDEGGGFSIVVVPKDTLEFTLVGYQPILKAVGNLDEVELTGGDLFQMKTISYNRNGIVATLGGGSFDPFARRVGDMPEVNAQFLVDLLANNLVKKVKYIPLFTRNRPLTSTLCQ